MGWIRKQITKVAQVDSFADTSHVSKLIRYAHKVYVVEVLVMEMLGLVIHSISQLDEQRVQDVELPPYHGDLQIQ